MSSPNRLSKQFEKLNPRERAILSVGVPVILLLVLYLIVISTARDRLHEAQQASDLTNQKLKLVTTGQLSTGICANSRYSLLTAASDEIISATAANLNLQLSTIAASEIELAGSNRAAANNSLKFVDQVICAGIPVEQLSVSIEPFGDRSPVRANVRFASGVQTP